MIFAEKAYFHYSLNKHVNLKRLIELANEIAGFVLIDRYIEEIAPRCIWLDNLLSKRKLGKECRNTWFNPVSAAL